MRPCCVALSAFLALSTSAIAADVSAREWTRGEARAFLAGNRTQPGVVETRSGLQYRIVEEGAGCRPKKNSAVAVSYQLRIGDDPAVADDSAKHGPSIAIALAEMIPAWKEGIPLMPSGRRGSSSCRRRSRTANKAIRRPCPRMRRSCSASRW